MLHLLYYRVSEKDNVNLRARKAENRRHLEGLEEREEAEVM